ncbi:hypothetical protein KAI04_02555 [Candidatus Pacearchaeota archaeon]|nr:hypothetical protein [Candidatus Pacearchaeota archaeon]
MKRLKAKSSEAKKQKKNQIIIGVILIIVMFGSVFGVIVGSFGAEKSIDKIKYNGFEFIKQSNFWVLELGNFNFIFTYNPNEVQEIETEVNFLNNYYDKPLYISSENSGATSEIVSNLNQIVLRMQNACFDENDCEGDLPLKTCEDNFIIIEEKNQTNIIQEENCVFIQGPQENLTQISDEFLFNILGVR